MKSAVRLWNSFLREGLFKKLCANPTLVPALRPTEARTSTPGPGKGGVTSQGACGRMQSPWGWVAATPLPLC